jgi:DNA polymerase I-like protein with 3'-5' exonuclease and polymerase domains
MAVGYDKNLGLLVKPHLDMLVDYLKGDLTYDIKGGSLTIQTAPLPPDYPFSRLALDIETYGILKGQTQTQFHPLKSIVHDGIPREKLVVTTGLTWYNPDGEMEYSIFIMSKEKHRRRLWSWIKKISRWASSSGGNSLCSQTPSSLPESSTSSRGTNSFEGLLGQNLKFDLMYLRHAYPECKTWLNYPLPIMDLSITNYLYNEGRPEKSLKALAPLLRVTTYLEGFTQHSHSTSRTLHQYNCQDTAATILSEDKLERLICDLYGKNTPKLTPFNREWYSKLLWLIVWMEEAGITMNVPALQGLMKSYEARMAKLERGIKNRWNINLRGKDSEKHKREIMNQACQTCLEASLLIPKLEKTPARKEISFKEENRNALLDVLPSTTDAARQLHAVGRVHAVAGILDRYLYPLLVGRGKGHDDPTTRLIEGKVYPRWYPAPSEYEDGGGGGTKQCRIVAKGPAVQTFPPPIKACVISRYGYLIWFDYSQIEFRIAALLSNDPSMMGEYNKPDCDFHLGTARKLFGEKDAKKFRPVGKTLNFLVIYLGGAGQYQTTLLRDEGIVRSYGQCQQDIDGWWKQAQGLRKWQEQTYEFVCEHGYFQLPLVGQSRLFLGNRAEVRDQMKEIVNMPVQAVAANIMLSAQFELQWAFMQKRMKAILPLNVYDAATIEFPKPELYAVKQEMNRILPDPPYYQALCETLGRRLPLKYDMKIVEVAA